MNSEFQSNREKMTGGLLIAIAVIFYFLKLGSLPNGYFQDEISLLNIAECLSRAGVDRHGFSWPYFFRDFGNDYRLPLSPYLTFLGVKFFGIGGFGLRFMGVLSGFFAAFALLFYARLQKWFQVNESVFGALVLFVLTSSWFWSGHRFAVETAFISLISVFQLIAFHQFFLIPRLKTVFAFAVSVSLGCLLYRAFIPLAGIYAVLFSVVAFYKNGTDSNRSLANRVLPQFLFFGLLGLILTWPIIQDLVSGDKIISRVITVTAGGHESFIVRLLKHIDGVFWFLKGDHNKRHHHGFFGEIHLALVFPFFFFLKDLFQKKLDLFWTCVFLLALASHVPAALTNDGIPHSNRSFIALIPLMACILKGVNPFWVWLGARSKYAESLWILGGALFSIASCIWYVSIYPSRSTDAWLPAQVALAPQTVITPEMRKDNPDTVFTRYMYLVGTGDVSVCKLDRE